jgi:hypothetical protein
MSQKKKHKDPYPYKVPPSRPKGWLWWIAFFILAVGSITAYLFSQEGGTQAEVYTKTTLLVTVIGAGIFVISAIADWFINR